MEKIKKYLNVLIWPIIFMIGQFLMLLSIGIVLKLIDSNINIGEFINNNSYIVSILDLIIFIPLFIKQYKKYKDNYNNKLTNILSIIIGGIVIAFVLNVIILSLKNLFDIEIGSFNFNIFYLINIIIVGPILEEYIFRGIVFNKLLEFNSLKKSYFISVILFALIHTGGIFNIIYAFIMGCILNYLYIENKNIRANILFHITINFVSNVLFPLTLILISHI